MTPRPFLSNLPRRGYRVSSTRKTRSSWGIAKPIPWKRGIYGYFSWRNFSFQLDLDCLCFDSRPGFCSSRPDWSWRLSPTIPWLDKSQHMASLKNLLSNSSLSKMSFELQITHHCPSSVSFLLLHHRAFFSHPEIINSWPLQESDWFFLTLAGKCRNSFDNSQLGTCRLKKNSSRSPYVRFRIFLWVMNPTELITISMPLSCSPKTH